MIHSHILEQLSTQDREWADCFPVYLPGRFFKVTPGLPTNYKNDSASAARSENLNR